MHNWLLSWATNTEKRKVDKGLFIQFWWKKPHFVGSVSTLNPKKETGFESFLQMYFFLKIEFEHKIVLFWAYFKEPGMI